MRPTEHDALHSGERQVSPFLHGIRTDHVARYRWAAERVRRPPVVTGLPESGARPRVMDAGCGIGYGAQLLAESGCDVVAVESSSESLAYADQHYPHARVTRVCSSIEALEPLLQDLGQFDSIACFEVLEHLEDPKWALSVFRKLAPTLLVSVPNETVYPFSPSVKFHQRHYTAEQFEDLLNACGWEVTEWHGQAGPYASVEPLVNGRTLVAVAQRTETPQGGTHRQLRAPVEDPRRRFGKIPKSVAIVAMGPSVGAYISLSSVYGGCQRLAEEIWAINAMGNTITHDRVFAMDDPYIQELRAAAKPGSNVDGLLGWMKYHGGPVYMPRLHPNYPGAVVYPLEEVANAIGLPYFNSTPAYALAFAIWLGVPKIMLYGMDFSYPNLAYAEQGRGCIELLIGVAMSRGLTVQVPVESSLLDANVPDRVKFYGYDTQDVTAEMKDGRYVMTITERPKEQWPTAEEMEQRYDHSDQRKEPA
jgi:SAM-dependent methyltransferase